MPMAYKLTFKKYVDALKQVNNKICSRPGVRGRQPIGVLAIGGVVSSSNDVQRTLVG